MAVLSASDKERTRYHTGYIETSFAASLQLGIPRPMQTIFLLEQSMNLLTDQLAVDRVHRILDTLDDIECQLQKAIKTLVAAQLGSLTLHPLKDRGMLFTDSLEKEYARWAKRLADILGIPLYPYSARFRKSGPGSNVGVRY